MRLPNVKQFRVECMTRPQFHRLIVQIIVRSEASIVPKIAHVKPFPSGWGMRRRNILYASADYRAVRLSRSFNSRSECYSNVTIQHV